MQFFDTYIALYIAMSLSAPIFYLPFHGGLVSQLQRHDGDESDRFLGTSNSAGVRLFRSEKKRKHSDLARKEVAFLPCARRSRFPSRAWPPKSLPHRLAWVLSCTHWDPGDAEALLRCYRPNLGSSVLEFTSGAWMIVFIGTPRVWHYRRLTSTV